jgi:octaheme c-type cytochrome (tetrathionate reductase family)
MEPGEKFVTSFNEENEMKARFMAGSKANTVLIIAVLLILGLLLFPITGSSADKLALEAGVGSTIQKVDLVTPEDFMEYASINDENIHDLYFSVILYEGTESCLMCHEKEGAAALEMGHFKWQGKTDRIVGLEGQSHGKQDLLNNFCIAIPSNEGRCTQCHAGIGYKDDTFNFQDPRNVDCLVCHDQSGTYAKAPTTAGAPPPSIDLNVVARSIALGADPTRKACIGCHAKAGGGDNVKHGDISTDMIATTREYDVHMGVDGGNFKCTACHGANHNPVTGAVNHGNAGMSLHSVNEGEMKVCSDCHGDQLAIHADTSAADLINPGWHERLACQTCHIPAIARKISTKTEWYWADAGQNVDPIPVDPATGRPTYDKKKGTFVWSNNVRPTLRYSNGNWTRMVINASDGYGTEPIQLAEPQGSYSDPDAMIYPFKLMVGNQVVDPVNKTLMVPHLFGGAGGPNPYWGKYDWNLALQDGSAYTGQPYSGTYGFASTEMLLSVNHEVAPKEQALGYGPLPDGCLDCHNSSHIDWQELGWTNDPFSGGDRVEGDAGSISDPGMRLD